jgi:hypothetical protein
LKQTVTENLRWVPPRVDMDMPHPARMHDYWLGGGHNFAADRELAEKIMQLMPGIEDVSRLNQAFLRRAALFMVDSGIRQFLDIGSGIPTVGNLHEIVQQAAPDVRVVYVDHDPVAVAHGSLMLDGVEGTAMIEADVRNIDDILLAEPCQRLLDDTRPIGLLAPMLHFVPDGWGPACIVAGYRDRLPSGSWLALLHATWDSGTPGLFEAVEAYRGNSYPVFPRPYEEVLAMCEGFELVEPGLVGFAEWRPDGPEDRSSHPGVNSVMYAAVGRKP